MVSGIIKDGFRRLGRRRDLDRRSTLAEESIGAGRLLLRDPAHQQAAGVLLHGRRHRAHPELPGRRDGGTRRGPVAGEVQAARHGPGGADRGRGDAPSPPARHRGPDLRPAARGRAHRGAPRAREAEPRRDHPGDAPRPMVADAAAARGTDGARSRAAHDDRGATAPPRARSPSRSARSRTGPARSPWSRGSRGRGSPPTWSPRGTGSSTCASGSSTGPDAEHVQARCARRSSSRL